MRLHCGRKGRGATRPVHNVKEHCEGERGSTARPASRLWGVGDGGVERTLDPRPEPLPASCSHAPSVQSSRLSRALALRAQPVAVTLHGVRPGPLSRAWCARLGTGDWRAAGCPDDPDAARRQAPPLQARREAPPGPALRHGRHPWRRLGQWGCRSRSPSGGRGAQSRQRGAQAEPKEATGTPQNLTAPSCTGLGNQA